MNKKSENNTKKIDNKYICDICFSKDINFYCNKCFGDYNKDFKSKKEKLEQSEKSLSAQIKDLLFLHQVKSEKLNKKLFYDKREQNLLERIEQENKNIEKLEKENNAYESLLSEQIEKNSRLKMMVESEKKKTNEKSNLFESAINIDNSSIIINENNNESEDIDTIKQQISELNSKIMDFKKNYIVDLFKKSFINNKALIKITDFFNFKLKQEEEKSDKPCIDFSILELKNYTKTNELKLEILKSKENNKNIFLIRFNSFFKNMVLFLETAYIKFKLEMPYKIDYPKIKANNFDYKLEIKLNELDEDVAVDNAIKGYHLLNINYEYLINYIFGDSKRVKYLFDMSFLITDENKYEGSLNNIREESQINLPSEIDDFVILE